jgi:hypothetical protein
MNQVVHELSDDESYLEKLIIERLSQHVSTFIQNRFYFKQIKFEDLKACYFYPVASSSIESEDSEEVYQQCKLLVKTLSEIGVYFKVPIDSSMFKWFNEHPVFTYTEPLCRVFEIIESKDQENIKFEELPEPHHTTPESLNVEMIPLEEQTIRGRLRIYEKIRFGHIRQIFAMMIFNETNFLLTEKLNCKRLKDEFYESTKEIKLKMIIDLLDMVLYLFDCNCFDATFDENSFFVNAKKEILMEVKDMQEIIPEYLPPELNGRSGSSASLVYGFGKILNSLYDDSGFIQNHFSDIIARCTCRNLIERMSMHELHDLVEKIS